MDRILDITGQKYGTLTVIKMLDAKKGMRIECLCKCDCDKLKIVRSNDLRTGKTASCGCTRTKHGDYKARLYQTWAGMKSRCKNKNNINYGGRGITVYDEWKSYINFREWALSNGYTNNLTIDRINSNGNYEPSNCRWETYKAQENNKRDNRKFQHGGKEYTLAELSDLSGISYSTLRGRLNYGWSIERAINNEPNKHNQQRRTSYTNKHYGKPLYTDCATKRAEAEKLDKVADSLENNEKEQEFI